LEVAPVTKATLAIKGLAQPWDPIRGAARAVKGIGPLDRWGEFSALYRVEPVAGQRRHYVVAEG
jgi:hypothetical protein